MENGKVVTEEKKVRALPVSNVDKLARLKLQLQAVDNDIDSELSDADITKALKALSDKKRTDRIADLKKIGINPDLLVGDGLEKNKVEVLRLEKLKRKEIADRKAKEKAQEDAEYNKLNMEQQKAWKAKKAELKRIEDSKKPVERVLTKEEKKAELAKKEVKIKKGLALSRAIDGLKAKMELTLVTRQSVALDAGDKGKKRKLRDHGMYLLAGEYMRIFQNTDNLKKLLGTVKENDRPAIQVLIDELEARLSESGKKDARGGAVANAKAMGGINTSPQTNAKPASSGQPVPPRPAYPTNNTGNK